MSLALVIAYLTLVLVVVTVIVLCCLGCGCHIPMGKCVRCFCDETKRCCRKQTNKLTEPETAADRRKREKDAPVLAGRRRDPNLDDEPPCAGCLRGIPWVLTCGYCCGAFGDSFTTNRQLEESTDEAKRRAGRGKAPVSVATAQPVFDDREIVGMEPVVAVSIPLLAVS